MAGPFTEGNPIDHVVSDGAGTVWPFASVQVNVHGGAAATIYADAGHATVLANPLKAGSDGAVRFFVAAGDYDFVATSEAGASKSVFVTVAQQVADVAVAQSSLTAQLAAYVPLLGGAAPVAGPPATSGTTVGQAQVDASGLMWVWNGNQWQLGGAGIELGYAEAAANYALTAAFAVPPGLTVPVNVPPGVDVEVECFCPWVLNGATGSNATYVALALYEDSTLIKTALNPFVTANMSSEAGVRASYTPSSAGEHTYSVQAKQNGTATATIEGGLQSGLLVSAFLRVRSV